MIIQAKKWNFVQLLCLFVHQLVISFNALLSMSFHVVWWRDRCCVRMLRHTQFSVAGAEIRDSNPSLYISQQCSRSVRIHVACIPNTHGQEMMLVLQDPQVSLISSTWESYSAFFQSFWCRPHIPIRTILAFGEQKGTPNSELFYICLHHKRPVNGGPYRFRSRGTIGSSIFDFMILAICLVEHVSIYRLMQWIGYFSISNWDFVDSCDNFA